MNFQRVFALVRKDLKKLVREPAVLFMIILFPAVMTLTFGLAFGGIGGSQSATYILGVVDDAPAEQNQIWTQSLIGNLTELEILEIQFYPDNETAQADLVQGKISAIVQVPEDFERSCSSYWHSPDNPNQWVNTTLQVYVDSGSMFATQAIQPIIQQAVTETVFGKQTRSAATPVQISNPSLVEATITTTFEFFAPGLFAFASIFLIMIVAQSFADDRESGLLRRIAVTPTSASEVMSSQVISNMVSAFVQAVIVFLMAYIVGYRPKGDTFTFAVAFVIVLIFSLCNVGFGLITATLAKSSGAATGLAFIFIMPQMFLGTFVGSALSGIAQSAGKFVPSYYVTDALTSLFLRGAPVNSPTIMLDITVVSVVSIATLLVGILLFRKYEKT